MGLFSFIKDLFVNSRSVTYEGLSIHSLPGLLIVENHNLKKESKEVKRAIKKIEKDYTAQKLGGIFAKLASPNISKRSLNRYQDQLKVFIEGFINQALIVRTHFLGTYQALERSLKAVNRQEYKTIGQLEELFQEINNKAPQMFFPTNQYQSFQKHSLTILKRLKDYLHNDLISDNRVVRGHSPLGVGIFSWRRYSSRGKILRDERKHVRLMGQDLRLFNFFYNKAVQELSQGTRPDFLFILIELFKRVGDVDKHMELIKADVKIILRGIREEISSFERISAQLHGYLHNVPQYANDRRLNQVIEESRRLNQLVFSIVHEDSHDVNIVYKELKNLVRAESFFVHQLRDNVVRLNTAANQNNAFKRVEKVMNQ